MLPNAVTRCNGGPPAVLEGNIGPHVETRYVLLVY